MKFFSKIPFVVRCFFLADLAVCLLYVGNYAVGRPWSKINLFLDLDHEGNFPAWYSSMQWATVSALMFFSGAQKRRLRIAAGLPLLFLGALFLFFSMDEVAQVHESLTEGINGKLLKENSIRMYYWLMVLGLPVFIFLWRFGLSIKSAFERAPGSLRFYLVGVTVFAVGAFVTEPMLYTVGLTHIPPSLILLEELLEMLGVTFLLWSGFLLAASEGLLAFLDFDSDPEDSRLAA